MSVPDQDLGTATQTRRPLHFELAYDEGAQRDHRLLRLSVREEKGQNWVDNSI